MFSTSNPGAGMHRKEMKMGDKFLELLLNGMKRFAGAFGSFWKRYTTPPADAKHSDIYTDQW